MWNEEKIEEFLKERLDEKRFQHVLGVKESAKQLCRLYKEDESKASFAALIHDCAKNMKDDEIIKLVKSEGYKIDMVSEKSPQLLHGLAGAIIGLNMMDVRDEDIFNAVRYHTTGRRNMSLLEKIVYLADYIEPSRSFPGVEELRKAAFIDIDRGVVMALENTIKYVLSQGELLHTDTVEARNFLLCR